MGFELCLQQKLSCWPKFWIVVQQPALMISCGGREEEEEEEEKAVVTCEILPWMIMIHIKHSTALHFWVTKSKRQQFSLQLLHMLLLSWVCSHNDHVLNSQLWQQLGDNFFLVHCGTASRCIIFAIRNRAQESFYNQISHSNSTTWSRLSQEEEIADLTSLTASEVSASYYLVLD